MKKTSLKWLGIVGMIGAPGLWLESSFYDIEHHQNTSIGGVFDLLYMIGWMCSVYGLLQLQAAGKKRSGNIILYIQLGLLAVANIWNVWEIIDPTSTHPIYQVLDKFWPASNLFMIVTGIAVIVAKWLSGYQRFVPLAAGLWLGITFFAYTTFGDNKISFYIMNVYSTLIWFLMGWVVFQNGRNKSVQQVQPKRVVVPKNQTHNWLEEVEETYL